MSISSDREELPDLSDFLIRNPHGGPAPRNIEYLRTDFPEIITGRVGGAARRLGVQLLKAGAGDVRRWPAGSLAGSALLGARLAFFDLR